MTSDAVPFQAVSAALRIYLPYFAIACIALACGIGALVLAAVRSRERLFLWVGAFSLIYAIRLFAENDLVRDAFGLRGNEFLPIRTWLTYLIPIPFALFGRELFAGGWARSVEIWLWFEIAFAAIAIPAAFLFGYQTAADALNGYLIIAGTVVLLVHLFFLPRWKDSFPKPLKWALLIFAVLVIANNRGFEPHGLDIEPIGFLVLLCGLVWTAAGHAVGSERKLVEIEQELATARRIQNSILPVSAPEVEQLQIATRYQPMTAVAGDFYDFLKFGPKQLTILVADVSGHGVPAALVASMLKVCFSAQRDNADDPAKVLTGLNRMLHGSLGGQYITAACAALDLEQEVLTYAGAGHPPSLLLRRAVDEIVWLEENGLFIGPFRAASYANTSVKLNKGDKVLLYTDGIVEATIADGEEFGRNRLSEFVASRRELKPAHVVEQLFQRIATADQQDDLTAVMVEFV